MQSFHGHNPYRGIGLLELMLSLLIIAALLFMVTRYFKIADENLRVSRAITMINTTVAASYKWLEGQSDFKLVSITQLKNSGLLPQNYQDGTGINPWGGDIQICQSTDQSGTKLQLVLTKVPPKSCTSLMEKVPQQQSNVAECGKNECNRSDTSYSFNATF